MDPTTGFKWSRRMPLAHAGSRETFLGVWYNCAGRYHPNYFLSWQFSADWESLPPAGQLVRKTIYTQKAKCQQR